MATYGGLQCLFISAHNFFRDFPDEAANNKLLLVANCALCSHYSELLNGVLSSQGHLNYDTIQSSTILVRGTRCA